MKAARVEPAHSLTDRERNVLRQTAQGFSSAEIGRALGISPKTVDTYRSRVMKKLHLGHKWELVSYALEEGLLRQKNKS
jgi:two-component system, NarL family, response regulator NreC